MRYEQARQTVLVGPGSIEALPDELRGLGASSVALFTSPHAGASAGYALLRSALTGATVVAEFDSVRPHAPVEDSERIAATVCDLRPDVLVAYGGGSVSDTAKAVSIIMAEGLPLTDHCSTFTPPDNLEHAQLDRPKTPVVTVPVTLSGAEVTPGGGATDADGIKRVFWDHKVASRVLAFDPVAISDVPQPTILTTAMNGLAHCAEALYSRTATPISDALAVDGATRFATAMPEYASGARSDAVLEDLLLAAYLGGSVISNARVGLHHAICHVLGAAFGVPHGVANTIMLPYVLEFNADRTEVQQARLAVALADGLGLDAELGAATLVRRLQERCGLPLTLTDAGTSETDLDQIATMVMQDRGLYFNPKRVAARSDVLTILDRALRGELGGAA